MACDASGVHGLFLCDNASRDGLVGAIGLLPVGASRKDLPVQYHIRAGN